MKQIIGICLLLISLVSMAQNEVAQQLRLAQQYYRQGEYEKAGDIYKDLFEQQPSSSHYYRNYYQCLIALRDFETAETLIKQQQKKRKNDPTLYVDLGQLYKNQNKMEQAEAEFNKAIKQADAKQLNSLGNVFTKADEHSYAVQAYQKGRQLNNNDKMYARELARAYQKLGDYPNMIGAYLDYVTVNPRYGQYVRTEFQKIMKDEDTIEEIQTQLYGRIQTTDNTEEEVLLTELLIWSFYQQKDFESAVIQVQALDRRLNETGGRLIDLAAQAIAEKQYDTAIEAYNYVIAKGEDNPLYLTAKISLLNTLNTKITKTNNYTQADIQNLKQDYLAFFELMGKNERTIESARELGSLYAYYIYDLDSAIALMQEMIDLPAISKTNRNRCKLDLGDYYLMKNEVWEATLLYSQVDKDSKDDILGEEARFKNARLAYFNGDFEYAQMQLEVLKASTSELIANDALDLSVFITDNTGLDTTTIPVEMYARAQLLMLQNKKQDALTTFDSINKQFPIHALSDDILLSRAKLSIEQRAYIDAVPYLEQLLKEHGDDILADNATFMLAELNEQYLNNAETAMEYYQDILISHPGSLFIVEARKRYRRLRSTLLEMP